MSDIGEEKAFSDWFIVKREILHSYYEASAALAEYWRYKIMGKNNHRALLDFQKNTLDLYMKVRAKIEGKKMSNKKDNAEMEKRFDDLKTLDVFLKGNCKKKISLERWVTFYFTLQTFVEMLGLTKIERKVLPAEESIMEGI
jgi:hypothetical protein